MFFSKRKMAGARLCRESGGATLDKMEEVVVGPTGTMGPPAAKPAGGGAVKAKAFVPKKQAHELSKFALFFMHLCRSPLSYVCYVYALV